jgi:hypothetical protein
MGKLKKKNDDHIKSDIWGNLWVEPSYYFYSDEFWEEMEVVDRIEAMNKKRK